MKRRLAKKEIRRAEKWIGQEIEKILGLYRKGEEDIPNETLLSFWYGLEYLLSINLHLDPLWHRERWLDGISLYAIRAINEESLLIVGWFWWGLVRDIGGEQWREPYRAVIKLTRKKRIPIVYDLVFGRRGKRRRFSNRNVA